MYINQDLEDGNIEADFVGGVWDGKSYVIPCVSEWRVAIVPIPKWKFINKAPETLVKYDVAVYTHILHGVYWLTRIEKTDE